MTLEPVGDTCEALTYVFTLLGKRWSGMVIGRLMDGAARFAELARTVPGISQRMLADRLAELTAEGLVEREVSPGPPVSVTYRLSPRGEALRPALDALRVWAGNAGQPGRDLPGIG